MQAAIHSIRDLLFPQKGNLHLWIPSYQRAYVWENDDVQNVEHFWTDLWQDCWHGKREHFFGAIILRPQQEGFETRWEVVDGQQRLLTFCLLVLAIRDCAREAKVAVPKLCAGWIAPPNIPLQLRTGFDQDQQTLDQIVSGILANDSKSRVAAAYRRLKTLICSCLPNLTKQSLEALLETFMSSSSVVCVWLGKEDKPDSIFETLNGRGQAVDPMDLVKNLILAIGSREPAQAKAAQDLWKFLITMTYDEDELQECLRVLGERDGCQTIRKTTYEELKHVIERAHETRQLSQWLIDTKNAAEMFGEVKAPSEQHVLLSRLKRLGATQVLDSLILRIVELDGYESPLLRALESVYVRLFFTSKRPGFRLRSLKEVCTDEVLGGPFFDRENWRHALVEKWMNDEFWRDEASFREGFLTKRAYTQSNKQVLLFLLEQLEGRLGAKMPVNVMLSRNCSLEHVMPQSLSPTWREVLGNQESLEQLHESLVHTIGNITVLFLNDNSKLGNRPYEHKRAFYINPDKADLAALGIKEKGPFHNSLLNKYFGNQAAWNFDAIRARGHMLCDIACQIWRPPYEYIS